MNKIDASQLGGVSETALLTLNGRAHQAGLPGAILHDPMAIKLRDSIDFDYDKFGRKGQEMALRSLAVDGCAINYLRTHPKATVVALAEGFQTSFWRLDEAIADPQFGWVSVDLPPVIELRERLLPSSPRITNLGKSALDYSWIDRVDSSNGVFITAEGLLMYLQPAEAMELIAQCAKHFPGGQMFFDLPPVMVKKLAPKGMRSIQALPRAADAVQPVGGPTRRPRRHNARRQGVPRHSDAEGARLLLREGLPRDLALALHQESARGLRPARVRLSPHSNAASRYRNAWGLVSPSARAVSA